MPTLHFQGEVLPAEADISLLDMPRFDCAFDSGRWLKISLELRQSNVRISVEAEAYSREDLAPIHRQSLGIVQGAVDLVAFSQGVGLTVVLRTVTEPDGNTLPLLFQVKSLAPICDSFSLSQGFDEMMRLVSRNFVLATLLNDLVVTLTKPRASAINCCRVVDGIKKLICPNMKEGTQRWKAVHDALRVESKYLRFITDRAREPRHGNPLYNCPDDAEMQRHLSVSYESIGQPETGSPLTFGARGKM